MTNGNRKWLYFSLGILTAILGWIVYTLYHIFGKPVLPTVKDNLTVDEDAECEAALKKYSEAVMSLDPHSLDDLDKTQPIRLYPNGNRKAVSWIEVMEINYPDVWEKFRATLDDTQPIKIEQEPSAKDLEDWAEYIG